MAIVKMKPTSAGRRLWSRSPPRPAKGEPHAPLLEKQIQDRRPQQPWPHHHPASGVATRRITTASSTSSVTRTTSRRAVERIEYDLNRTAHIALVLYRRWRASLHHRAARPAGPVP